MEKKYLLLLMSLVFTLSMFGDEYAVLSWEKSKLSADTAVSADKVLIGKKAIEESRQLRLNPYDSLVIINTKTDKASTYVNTSKKVKVLRVKEMVKRKSLHVIISMLGDTFSPKQPEPQKYKLLGTTSRREIKQGNVDYEHMKIYNTLLDYMEKDKSGGLLNHGDVRFYTDTTDNIISFSVENYSKNKSYIVNVLVADPETGKLNMAITFPEYSSSPAVVVGPHTRIELDGIGYALREKDPLKFYLVVSTKPYDPNYLSLLMQADNIKPTREGKNKDIVCVPAE